MFQTKKSLDVATEDIAKSKKAVDLCHTEFLAIKTQCAQLELQRTEDQANLKEIKIQNAKLRTEHEAFKKIEVYFYMVIL